MICLIWLVCRCSKTFFQISDDIINVLRANGQADGVRVDVLILQFLHGKLGMGGGGRVNDEALYVRYVGKQRENFQCVDEGVGLLHATLDVKGKDRRSAVREVLFKQRMVGMLRQGGMIDFLHLRVIGQK